MRYQLDENCPKPDDFERRMRRHERHFLVGVIIWAIGMTLVIGAALFTSLAHAQTVTRNAKLDWSAPTTCQGGAPISTCPLLGYSIQRLTGTTWQEIATTTASVRTYTDANITLPQSYRVLAVNAAGAGNPSNEVVKIDVPGNVVLTVTVTVTATTTTTTQP